MIGNKIVFLGAPGSGKGTQAKILKEKFGFLHISTGDLIRRCREKSPKSFSELDRGGLVDDASVLSLVREELATLSPDVSVIFDGFPRTVDQAKSFDISLGAKSQKLQVVFFKIEYHTLLERISGRLVCSECGKMFHERFSPPDYEGMCSHCDKKTLEKRSDDDLEIFKKRYAVYEKETKPLFQYYQSRLFVIDGESSSSEISEQLILKLNYHCL